MADRKDLERMGLTDVQCIILKALKKDVNKLKRIALYDLKRVNALDLKNNRGSVVEALEGLKDLGLIIDYYESSWGSLYVRIAGKGIVLGIAKGW